MLLSERIRAINLDLKRTGRRAIDTDQDEAWEHILNARIALVEATVTAIEEEIKHGSDQGPSAEPEVR